MTLDCPSCGQSTTPKTINSRVLHYYCEDCDLLHVVTTHGKYHPGDEKVMMLEYGDKSFKLRDKQYSILATQTKTVIPL